MDALRNHSSVLGRDLDARVEVAAAEGSTEPPPWHSALESLGTCSMCAAGEPCAIFTVTHELAEHCLFEPIDSGTIAPTPFHYVVGEDVEFFHVQWAPGGRIYCSPLRPQGPQQSLRWLTGRRSAQQRRQWDARAQAIIVIEGLKGKPVAAICNEYQMSPSPYYQGRDQFLAHAGQAFEVHQHTKREVRLEQENARRKRLVGERPLELTTSDELLA